MLVLDASAATELLLGTPLGRAVAARLEGEQGPLHAPHLLDVEVTSALRRLVHTRAVRLEEADEALANFALLPIARYAHVELLGRAWRLRATVSAYGAMYVALAEALAAPLLTCDARLAAAKGHAAEVLLAREPAAR